MCGQGGGVGMAGGKVWYAYVMEGMVHLCNGRYGTPM